MPNPPRELKSNPTYRIENGELIIRLSDRDFIFTQEQWERFTYHGDLAWSEHFAKKAGK